MMDVYDAVVIGAGVAGSSMAQALAGMGWQTVLLDQASAPRHKACGEFLSPEASRSLQALGLEEAIRRLAPPRMTAVRLHAERGASLEIPLPGEALGVSRFALDAELRRLAQSRGVRLLAGAKVLQIAESGFGYRIRYASGESDRALECRTVIAAWGRRPPAAFRPPPRKRARGLYVGIKAHYQGSDFEPAVDLYFFRGGYLGIAPVEQQRLNAAALVSVPALGAHRPADRLASIVEEAAARVPFLRKRLEHAAVIPGTQAGAYPVQPTKRPAAWNGIPCVGDAAAVIPPLCGDGMSMALRSVELCAPLADAYLRGRCSLAGWKAAYTDALERQFAGPLRWGAAMERLLVHPFLSAWLLKAGALAPKTAQRLVRFTRLDG